MTILKFSSKPGNLLQGSNIQPHRAFAKPNHPPWWNIPFQYKESRRLQEKYHMGKSVDPHIIRPALRVGVLVPQLSVSVCVSVCARKCVGGWWRGCGLCDISRLPIWLGEWTPSNYSCSYCLINLFVSLPHPPQHSNLFFFLNPILQRSML